VSGLQLRAWSRRALLLVAIILGGQAALTWLDFGPRLAWWALLMTCVAATVWLLLDANDASAADWRDSRPPLARSDVGEDSAYTRLVHGHLDATEPGPALRDRLLALGRTRDPELRDPGLRELAQLPVRRLSPADIDRYLTRIEALGEERPVEERLMGDESDDR
jgi:hypothetical protein